MAPEKSPAFQFYVDDWRGSRKVQHMSFKERGMYLEMLIEQWDKRSVPDDPAKVAALIGGSVAEWTRSWANLRSCFTNRYTNGLLVNPDGHMVNLKLESIRAGLKKFKKSQASSGLAGATERWRRHRLAIGSPSKPIGSPSKPIASPIGLDSSSSSSSSSTPSSSSSLYEESTEASSVPAFLTYPVVGPKGHSWLLSDAQVSEWAALFPGLDVSAECRKALAWLQANPLKRKTANGMPRFLAAWLTRATDRGGSPALSVVPPLGKLSTRMAMMVGKARAEGV